MSTPYVCEFWIPKLPKMPNQLLGAHWRTRSNHKKLWTQMILRALPRPYPKAPLRVARLALTRRSSVQPDYDGLAGSFKPVIDSLVQLGVLANDTSANIGVPTYLWEKASPGQGSIRIRIEEVSS